MKRPKIADVNVVIPIWIISLSELNKSYSLWVFTSDIVSYSLEFTCKI